MHYEIREQREANGLTPEEALYWYNMMPKTADGYVPNDWNDLNEQSNT